MPNPSGINQYGEKKGKLTSWKRLVKRLKIPTVRTQKLPLTTVEKAVVDEVGKDPTQSRGPDFMQDQLRLKRILPPRDLIRKIMLDKFPDGFDNRFPGRKGKWVARVPLHALGPYHEVSSDGHEKIPPSALRMGGVGFSIYGVKDKFADYLLFLKIYPDVRSRGAGRHIFLDFVQETGCRAPSFELCISMTFLTDIPIQLTTDKGSELFTVSQPYREIYAADIDKDLYPFHVLIKSIHNTVIEGFWRQLKEKLGLNLKDFLLRGKIEHLFNAHDPWHEPLFYWIFAPLIQAELDNFKLWWNHHRVRHQHEKILPSGHVPAHALEFPELFGALDCRIAIPQEAINNLRDQLTKEEGPQEDYQTWPGLTPEFNVYAADVYSRIGEPELTLASGWDVFVEMARMITLDSK
ncbi:hypothetical protein K438DRAFT_1780895 [Mycena galopus ATCC 62051]|nr:hypothetical protein K438DRAFT_1780895 [Mycena galopus ATCC 62051]